jgi:hypothetical protein
VKSEKTEFREKGPREKLKMEIVLLGKKQGKKD